MPPAYQLSPSTDDTQKSCSPPSSSLSRSAATMPRSSYSKNAPIEVGKTTTGGPAWPKTSSSMSRPSDREYQR